MENQWAIPPTDPQSPQQIPPTAELPAPAFQPNMPTYQRGENPIIQNCSCSRCSAVQYTQAGPPIWYPIEQQDPRHFGTASTPYLNQGQDADTGAEIAIIVPDRALVQPAPPLTGRIQDDFGYAPVHEIEGLPNMRLTRAQTPETSIAESRRRLAGRYLSNPDAYVSTIRLTNVI